MSQNNYTSSPWKWVVHDYSMATLSGPTEEEAVLAVSPCKGCTEASKQDAFNKIDWKWGRCSIPKYADAKLIESSPELYEALRDEVFGSDVPCEKNTVVRCICKICRRDRSLNALKKVGDL